MDNQGIIRLLLKIGEEISLQKEFLTDLDSAIGDGDHGINMARGFAEVSKKLPGMMDKDIGSILKAVGMTLVSTVGGSAGPLYGTAFMKAGMSLANQNDITMDSFLVALKEGIEGVKMRGKAVAGEKTMLDSMIPAYEVMCRAKDENKTNGEILSCGVDAARKGVEYTKSIIATKGRASYLGERSIGHQDPGATSFCTILETIANFESITA